jgi:hypothetical protein
MLLAKKYKASDENSQEKVKLMLLAPVDSIDECTHIVLTLSEYSDLNKAKVCLNNILQSEMRKLDYLALRNSCTRNSNEWKAYDKKLKGASIIRLRTVRRVITIMGLGTNYKAPGEP